MVAGDLPNIGIFSLRRHIFQSLARKEVRMEGDNALCVVMSSALHTVLGRFDNYFLNKAISPALLTNTAVGAAHSRTASHSRKTKQY